VYAVSFVIAAASVAGIEAVERLVDRGRATRTWTPVAAPLLLVVAAYAYGVRAEARWRRLAGETRQVAVVQDTMPTAFQWRREFYARTIDRYARLTENARRARGLRPDLVVWPENAANFYLAHEPRLTLQLARLAAATNDGLLVGGPRLGSSGSAHNAVQLVGPEGRVRAYYDKRRLVPFAEYDPLGWSRRIPAADEPAYAPGRGVASPALWRPRLCGSARSCYRRTYFGTCCATSYGRARRCS
jgi:apolipoprotein N-acyltransferase